MVVAWLGLNKADVCIVYRSSGFYYLEYHHFTEVSQEVDARTFHADRILQAIRNKHGMIGEPAGIAFLPLDLRHRFAYRGV